MLLPDRCVNKELGEANVCEVVGTVAGLQGEDYAEANVILYNGTNAYQEKLDAQGNYSFVNVIAGEYYIKVEVEGYTIPQPVAVAVNGSAAAGELKVEKAEGKDYFYQWKADETYFGYEESAKVPEKKQVTFLGNDVYVCDSLAADKLHEKYNIVLSDEEEKWSSEYASRMFELVSKIQGYNKSQISSKWILTKRNLPMQSPEKRRWAHCRESIFQIGCTMRWCAI